MLSYITTPMKVKVLYIITGSDTGGAQKYVQDLANNLNQDFFETKILYGGLNLKWLSNAVRPWQFFINDWLAIGELVRAYNREKPDIIHLNSSKAGILGALAAFFYKILYRPLSSKVVFTAHGWVFNPTNDLTLLKRWFYIVLHKISAWFQDFIICVSEYDRKLASQYNIASIKKIIVVHNGIDTSIKFLDKETAKKELLKKLSISNYQSSIDKPWIGSIGRLVKEKNYETFIAAAALIPNAGFFIIGSGPEQEKLKAQSSRLKANVNFIEPTGNDAQYLKAFDIFAMSSIKEGLPYILLEAMLAELPVVVTETGGIPEMIKNHENGFLVAQKNPDLLAKAINGLLANKKIAEGMATMAKDQAIKKFNLSAMIEKTESVYKNL